MLGYPKTVGDRNWLHFGKNCYSGVAFFRLAAVPMLLIAAGNLLPDAFFVNFLEVCFRRIETNDVWVRGIQEFNQFATVDCSTDTIDIP